MTTLITGAGLIGAHVGRELQELDEQIIFCDLAPSRDYLATIVDTARAHIVRGDITDLQEMASLARRFRVDTIVHTAGLIGARVSQAPFEGIRVNVDGTAATMEAAHQSGVKRFVFSSSMAIYDFERLPSKTLITEDSPAGPKNLYAATKLACEHLLDHLGAIYGIQVVHLRLAGVYGRGQYLGGSWMGRVLNRVLEALIAETPVTIKPEWLGTNEYVYVKDVARAFLSACSRPDSIGGAFNIGTGALHTFADVIQEIRALAPGAKIVIEDTETPVVSYLVRDQPFDISKARSVLGYQPRFTLGSGLEDYLHELSLYAGC